MKVSYCPLLKILNVKEGVTYARNGSYMDIEASHVCLSKGDVVLSWSLVHCRMSLHLVAGRCIFKPTIS